MLSQFPPDELWKHITGEFIIVMDDCEFVTNHVETCYSNYVWEFHRRYPDTPFLKEHHLTGLR